MKKELTTAIIAAVFGVIVAYFITNIALPEISNVSFKTLSGNQTYTLAQPDPEVFNYRAVNPTVEVYVGQCREYNEAGECIDDGITTPSDNGEDNGENSGDNGSTDNPTPGGE